MINGKKREFLISLILTSGFSLHYRPIPFFFLALTGGARAENATQVTFALSVDQIQWY